MADGGRPASTVTWILLAALAVCAPAGLRAQELKPATAHAFDCYVQSAEARLDARKAFLAADLDAALNERLVRGQRVETFPANGANPHKLPAAHLYDWTGSVFIPGGTADRTIRLLQDYDHRAQYFPDMVWESKLACRTGDGHFQYSMQLKQSVRIEVHSDVVWERVDQHRWRCRSYATSLREIGSNHGYLLRLYSYWRVAEVEKGIYVEGESISLSGEFGAMARAFGSVLLGLSPEKTLRRSLASIREQVLNQSLQFAGPPAGLPACGDVFRPARCEAGQGN
ncbi:MAG: hypothetical protein ABSE42_16045 [Bryobacteraceae bacterium]|jgi:hypothetical protein